MQTCLKYWFVLYAKGKLQYDKEKQELICRADRLAYPVRDGIPIMWEDQARVLEELPDKY